MREFDFLAPKSLNAALHAIHGNGENYRLLAGGTNLIANLRAGDIVPQLIVDIGGIKALKYIKKDKDTINIGSLVTIVELLDSPIIKNHALVLWEAARNFAGPLVRNRATVGGNLVDASPAADSAVPLLALKASVKLQSLKGSRTLGLDNFFIDYRKTAIKSGEILIEVAFPIPPPASKQAYCKVGRRNAMAISVASAAMVLRMNGNSCADASIALGAVAPIPFRARKAEALLLGKVPDEKLAMKCGETIAAETKPIDDIRASAEYRRLRCNILGHRTLCQVLGLRDEGSDLRMEGVG
jgi:carbon-monoxide dehydrogenase medium subunit